MMLSEPWKQKLIRFPHTNLERKHHFKSGMESSKTILGRKIYPSKIMTPNFPWQQKIKGVVRYDEPLSMHTSNRIGGPADVFILPKGLQDLQTILKNRKGFPMMILGEGSNLLFKDKGFRGIVVSLKDCFKTVHRPVFTKRSDEREIAAIRAGASVKLSYLAKYAARYSLTGIENLVGIPGSLGGSLVMNAGAEGTEIGQVIRSVKRVMGDGKIQTLKKEDIKFEYRKTTYPPGEGIIIEAELILEKGDLTMIHDTIDRHLGARSFKQPLNMPNSGSVFKNPPGNTAGRLIEEAGLKGFSIGNACVSLKHANFIVNKGNATAKDFLNLIKHIQSVVKEKTGKQLETEIIVAGE